MLHVQERSGSPCLYQGPRYPRPSGYLTRGCPSREGQTMALNLRPQLAPVG